MRIGRWLLVCAALAVAGGLPSIHGGYAEVAAAQVVAVRHARRAIVAAPSLRAPRIAIAIAPLRSRAVAAPLPLWLAHSSLLL